MKMKSGLESANLKRQTRFPFDFYNISSTGIKLCKLVFSH